MLAQFSLAEIDVRTEALRRGMNLVCNPVHSGGLQNTWHWMFNDGESGLRILDYWPTNGKWWCRRSGEKGICKNVMEAVEIASKIAALPWQRGHQ